MPVKVDKNAIGDDSIVFFGDSLPNNSLFVKYLLELMPQKHFKVQAIGGQTWEQIMCRQGSRPIFITVDNNQTVDATTVNISNISTQFLSTAADSTVRKVSGTVAGLRVIITRTRVSGVEAYTLNANVTTTNSTAYPIPANAPFIPDSRGNHLPDILCLWAGRNNSPNFGGLLDANDAAFSILPLKRFLTIGVLAALVENSAATGPNKVAYDAIIAYNNSLRAAYPDSYIESTPPTTAEMAAINYTPIAQDLAEIATGVFPATMRSDGLHVNSIGYQIYALRIQKALRLLGYE